MIDKATVLNILSGHQGEHNGVSAATLAWALDTSERNIRHCITQLREEGIAVCGHPNSGYFIAATPAEIERTCEFLRARAMHSLTLESKLRHVPLPELIGQMRLKT